MTRVTGRRAAESAAELDWPDEDWPDKYWAVEIEASTKHNIETFRKRMAPPLSWGAARHRKNAGRSGSCATTRPLQGFRHLSGDLWSRGCKFSILRWLEPA